MSRINRATYWLGLFFVYAIVLLVSSVSPGAPSITTSSVLAILLLGPPRIHDIGLSAWYLLLPVGAALIAAIAAESAAIPALPFLSIPDAVLILGVALLGAIPGKRGANRFGMPQGHGPLRRR